MWLPFGEQASGNGAKYWVLVQFCSFAFSSLLTQHYKWLCIAQGLEYVEQDLSLVHEHGAIH